MAAALSPSHSRPAFDAAAAGFSPAVCNKKFQDRIDEMRQIAADPEAFQKQMAAIAVRTHEARNKCKLCPSLYLDSFACFKGEERCRHAHSLASQYKYADYFYRTKFRNTDCRHPKCTDGMNCSYKHPGFLIRSGSGFAIAPLITITTTSSTPAPISSPSQSRIRFADSPSGEAVDVAPHATYAPPQHPSNPGLTIRWHLSPGALQTHHFDDLLSSQTPTSSHLTGHVCLTERVVASTGYAAIASRLTSSVEQQAPAHTTPRDERKDRSPESLSVDAQPFNGAVTS